MTSTAPAPRRTRRRRWAIVAALWALAFALVAVSVLFARDYPLRGHGEELTDLGKLANYRHDLFWRFIAGASVMTIAAALGPALAWRAGRAERVAVVSGAVGSGLAFAFLYPVSAIDVFIYAARSRLFTEYGLDPLIAHPNDYVARDAYFRFASQEWGSHGSPYGPLWNLIAAPATLLGGADITTALAVFKLLALLAYLAGGLFIWRAVERQRPGRGAAAAAIYWWNPVVLWEGVGNAHNDLVMMAFILAAAWAWSARRGGAVIPLLVLAALMKYVAVILIPLAGVAMLANQPSWRARLRLVGWWIAGTAAALLVGLAPFYDVDAVRASIRDQGSILLTSPMAVLVAALVRRGANPAIRDQVIRYGQWIAGAAIALLMVASLVRRGRLMRWQLEATFIFLIAATPALRPWYAIWIVGLAALLPLGWPTARAVAYGAGAVFSYGISIWIWNWTGASFDTIQRWIVISMLGPVVLFTLAEVADALIGALTGRRARATLPAAQAPVRSR